MQKCIKDFPQNLISTRLAVKPCLRSQTCGTKQFQFQQGVFDCSLAVWQLPPAMPSMPVSQKRAKNVLHCSDYLRGYQHLAAAQEMG